MVWGGGGSSVFENDSTYLLGKEPFFFFFCIRKPLAKFIRMTTTTMTTPSHVCYN